MIKSVFRSLNPIKHYHRIFYLAIVCSLVFVLALWLVPLPKRVAVDYSVMVYSRDGVLLRPYLAEGDVWRFPVDIDSLPDFVIPALLAREDKRFYQHIGIDPIAIGRALLQNIQSQRVISGGSTITMQLVRLLEPRPRTLWSKLIETFRAIQLETYLSKDDILRLYLAYAPYGGNIEGIHAASYVYFGHAVSEITAGEMAMLLLLPQAPSRWHAFDEQQWRSARARVLDELVDKHIITYKQKRLGLHESVPQHRLAMPMLAPHYTDFLKKKDQEHQIQSSLAIDVQRMVEQMVARIYPKYQELGIHNVSILVADNKSREVRAAIGNFKYLSGKKWAKFHHF
ncbi:MAG: transglycosylase domain-containing protein [Flavobacteriales bacterium]|nr:transglycosylase domain-containing protein [Flavobacteriales bacterium]